MPSLFSAVLVAVSLSPWPVLANDARVESVGGTLALATGRATVSLDAEVVRAWLTPGMIEVECFFYLRNAGNDTTVTIAFPELAYGGARTPRLGSVSCGEWNPADERVLGLRSVEESC